MDSKIKWYCLGCKQNFSVIRTFQDYVTDGKTGPEYLHLKSYESIMRAGTLISIEYLASVLGVRVSESEKKGWYGICVSCQRKAEEKDPHLRKARVAAEVDIWRHRRR